MVSNDTREMGIEVGRLKRTKNKSDSQDLELVLYKQNHETKII